MPIVNLCSCGTPYELQVCGTYRKRNGAVKSTWYALCAVCGRAGVSECQALVKGAMTKKVKKG